MIQTCKHCGEPIARTFIPAFAEWWHTYPPNSGHRGGYTRCNRLGGLGARGTGATP